jgi:Transmembrane domain of unknown function (DUF3566)
MSLRERLGLIKPSSASAPAPVGDPTPQRALPESLQQTTVQPTVPQQVAPQQPAPQQTAPQHSAGQATRPAPQPQTTPAARPSPPSTASGSSAPSAPIRPERPRHTVPPAGAPQGAPRTGPAPSPVAREGAVAPAEKAEPTEKITPAAPGAPAKTDEHGPHTVVMPIVAPVGATSPTSAPAPVPAKETLTGGPAAKVGQVGQARRTRKARLRLSRLDPWSVMKTSFLFSIAAGIMLVVAVYVVWTVLASSGLFTSMNEIVGSVISTPGDTTPFRVEDYVNTQKVMGVTALIACVDVVIFTSLATLGSFLYNLAATMLGGLEITLAED